MGERIAHVRPAEPEGDAWRPLGCASLSPRLRSLYGSLQSLPVLGTMARTLVARVLPRGSRVWVQPRAGLAQGLWLNVDPRYESAYAQELYEPILQKVLAGHLTQGDTFYDVGAHIGFFSLIAARLVGESGRVFAFEADPQNVRRIEEHISKSLFGQIQVFPVAVWSRSGSLCFQRASELSSHNTGSVASASAESTAGETIEVKAVTLDEFVENQKAPTLIKIDVEGGETDVLRGADRLLAEARPDLICEVHNEEALSFIESYLAQKRYSLQCLNREADSRRHVLAQPL